MLCVPFGMCTLQADCNHNKVLAGSAHDHLCHSHCSCVNFMSRISSIVVVVCGTGAC
jgi:hypothetical protein